MEGGREAFTADVRTRGRCVETWETIGTGGYRISRIHYYSPKINCISGLLFDHNHPVFG